GIVLIVLTATTFAFASEKASKFQVKGNCGMCEKRIETAAQSVKGVSTADWNKEVKEITITYNGEKSTLDKVHKAIAKAGHDTSLQKAGDEAYNKLHSCCRYDRATTQKKN